MESHKQGTSHEASTRGAVRVDTSFKIEFRRLEESELHDLVEEITSHRTNDRLGYPPPESDLPADLDNLKDYQEITPHIMKMWVSIEQKLNVLMKLAGDKAHGIPNAEKGIVKDISAKGLMMKTDAELNKDEYLMLRISPPTFPSFILDTVGKVLSSDPAGKDVRHCKVAFTALNPDDREILIAYVFKRQREILRSRLEDETERKEKGDKADG
jgi:hypothetical protein